MITKERLEELKKQQAKIWHWEYDEIKLDNNTEICEVTDLSGNKHLGWCLSYDYEYKGEKYSTQLELEDLEENIEKGKWEYKMHVARTERFEPPMWEEIEEHYTFDWLNKGHHYRLAVDRPHQCVVITDFTIKEDIFDELTTKENYIKACEMVRDLFKGEK